MIEINELYLETEDSQERQSRLLINGLDEYSIRIIGTNPEGRFDLTVRRETIEESIEDIIATLDLDNNESTLPPYHFDNNAAGRSFLRHTLLDTFKTEIKRRSIEETGIEFEAGESRDGADVRRGDIVTGIFSSSIRVLSFLR